MTSDTWTREDSNLYQHAQSELTIAGLFDEDADYGGMLAAAVLELVETFARQAHSGASAAATLDIFNRVITFSPLTPITDDTDEWMHVSEEMAGDANLWQNRRQSSAFSNDGGKTFYDLTEPLNTNGTQVLHPSVHKEK